MLLGASSWMNWISVKKKRHSILRFRCFKLLGHCNRLTFLLRFFLIYIFHDLLCVDILDRSCLHFFMIWFSAVFFFGIQYLAFGFWHLLLAYSVKHFVSVSWVTFWHLYNTHAFHQRLGSFPSLAEAVRIFSRSIRLHVHLNILQTY